jgi:tRNA dimethylallyltransferase
LRQLAIIGPTASGKSDLAIKIAKQIDAYILSIDSLSVYKEIDVVSAKPSKNDLESIKHFGINILYPNEYFSVDIFIDIYKKLVKQCVKDSKNLVIVGGTSFYLKTMLQGLSELPIITDKTTLDVKKELGDIKKCYKILNEVDPSYMQNIKHNDSYRIEKALLIYRASNLTPTQWFDAHPPTPIIKTLKIYNIDVSRDILRDRIYKRTSKMLDSKLIDEVCFLEQKYTRLPNSMGSIGIVEVLEYLDAKVTKDEMLENISIHTAQLAKRQQTFNKTQFKDITNAPLDKLEKIILQDFDNY